MAYKLQLKKLYSFKIKEQIYAQSPASFVKTKIFLDLVIFFNYVKPLRLICLFIFIMSGFFFKNFEISLYEK